MAISDFLERIKRIDQLIRMQATGTPDELAKKLGMVKSTLYTYINAMKEMKAPIKYNDINKSFYYEEKGKFIMNFYCDELSDNEKIDTSGENFLKLFSSFFYRFD